MVSKDGSGGKYGVEFRNRKDIKPSPENDAIYGAVQEDEQFEILVESIREHGLEEPLIVTRDDFILSGHRRFSACQKLEFAVIPVRVKDVYREGHADYHKLLTEYNPQRVKSAASLLKEALLRAAEHESDQLFEQHQDSLLQVDAEFLEVDGEKSVKPIGPRRQEFLEAVKRVVFDKLREFWPLSIRQIHYNLLNDPPLRQVVKRSKFGADRWRYRNDKESYNALVDLLTPARYLGEIPMNAIDDATRPRGIRFGYQNASDFINEEVSGFLSGYHVDKQLGQPRHIEVFGEKNTLLQIVKPICREYYVPFSLGRGYCSVPVWRDIARRFRRSEKRRMTLIVMSDFDPEGLDLADDAERSLRDLWNLPVDTHRIALTREQINDLDLAADFNPAKPTSSRYRSFVERTGSNRSWELESVHPSLLRELLKAAIEANMDMEVFERLEEQEHEESGQISDFRRQIIDSLGI